MPYRTNDKRKSDESFPKRKKPRKPVLSLEISEDCAEGGGLFWPDEFLDDIKTQVVESNFQGAASIWQWTTTSVNFGRGPELSIFFAFAGFPEALEDSIRQSFAKRIDQGAGNRCVKAYSDSVHVDGSWILNCHVQDGAVWMESIDDDEYGVWVAS